MKTIDSNNTNREQFPHDAFVMNSRLTGKVTITLFILIGLALTVPRLLFHQGVIGGWVAIISTTSALAVLGIWIGKRSWDDIQVDSGAESEQSRLVAYPFETACRIIPTVVTRNHWKMLEANERAGLFKAKIGFSFWTISQTVVIQVSRLEDKSAKVDVRCKAYRQSIDYGQNNRMIAKFLRELGKSLNFS